MKQLNLTLILLAACLGFCSCDDVKNVTLYFVGDSEIARWDLQECFPSYVCHNNGVSGSGITYIELLKGQYAGKNVVLLFGTNNSDQMVEATREEFAGQYVDAVLGLGADRVYLFSILPRDFDGDTTAINQDIAAFNSLVRDKVAAYPSIVYIDVFNDFLRSGVPNPQYYNDGLHLSDYGYEILKSKLENKL